MITNNLIAILWKLKMQVHNKELCFRKSFSTLHNTLWLSVWDLSTCLLVLCVLGPFNNYMGQFWPNLTPHPPRVDKHGHLKQKVDKSPPSPIKYQHVPIWISIICRYICKYILYLSMTIRFKAIPVHIGMKYFPKIFKSWFLVYVDIQGPRPPPDTDPPSPSYCPRSCWMAP